MHPLPEPASLVSSPHGTEDPPMAVTVTDTSQGVTVTVRGEIDLAVADRLRQALAHAVTRCATGAEVGLDLGSVTFCDCSGLNVLLRARRSARSEHRSLAITAAARPVARLLEATGTAALFGRAP